MKIMQKFKLDRKRIAIILGAILFILFIALTFKNTPKELTLFEYDNFLQSNSITHAKLSGNQIIFTARNKNYYVLKDSINLNELAQKVAIKVDNSNEHDIFAWMIILFSLIVIFVLLYAKKIQKDKVSVDLGQMVSGDKIIPVISNVGFKDVAGIKEVKIELMEIVDFLKNPRKYLEFNIKMPKGILMIGPPGVGKTLVAKAVAGEAGVPFFYQSGAGFVQMYVGVGAKRVRQLFSIAKSYAPSIIFIDEIDSVGKARGGGRNDEREATLNQLLTEMDGFTDNSGVIVIGATNKIEMIDEALLRSGRFDRRIFLGLPDYRDRVDILNTYLRDKAHEVDIEQIARNTTGFSGAGLSTLVNEAAINTLRENRICITNDDFKAVENKVLHGKQQIISLNNEEKEIQALYKAAKALAAEWFGVDFDKISLLEDRFLVSEDFLESNSKIIARIKVCLAGSTALKIYKNEQYTNQARDIEEARTLAKLFVIDYGMKDTLLGTNTDIQEVLDNCQKETEEFVKGIEKQLFLLSEFLKENEIVNKNEVYKLIRQSYDD